MVIGNTAVPAVAVVMPVFNRETTVERAIDSVLHQTFGDFEFLVVDDGSTDGTAAAIARFGDRRIRYLAQPRNLGACAARNRGIREARSPLVTFLDSDDSYLPHKLAYVVDYFARCADVDVLIDSYAIRYPPGKRRPDILRVNPVLKENAQIEEAIFARRMFKPTPSLTARRQALLAAGLFDETLKRRQDMDLILRLTRHASCATTDEVLWTKYWTQASISAEQKTFMSAMIEICKRHPQYLSQPEFRVGLARDMARHFMRLLRTGEFSAAANHARQFARFQGAATLVGLTAQGAVEMVRRSRKDDQCGPRTSLKSESTSPARSSKTSESWRK